MLHLISFVALAPATVFTSPSGALSLRLDVRDGQLSYELKRGSQTLVGASRLGLVYSDRAPLDRVKGLKATFRSAAKKVFTGFAREGVSVPYTDASVEVSTGEKAPIKLEFRVSNSGVAWRQSVEAGRVVFDRAEWNLPSKGTVWTQGKYFDWGPYEGVWEPTKIGDLHAVKSGPVTIDLDGKGYLLITEAADFDLGFSGAKYAIDGRHVGVSFGHDPTGFDVDGKAGWTPWRVTLAAKDLNELTTNGFIDSLAPDPDPKLFPQGQKEPWIKPGRSAWSWWDSGDVSFDAQKRYTDMAAEFGFENNLIDEGWERWDAPSKDKWENLRTIVAYGKAKGVAQWVWKHWSQIGNPDNNWKQMRDFMDQVKAAGAVGMKIDFMDNDSQSRRRFYDAAMRATAERHLMINFHGANAPGGESQTYPNHMTREGIFGMEQNGWTTIPLIHYAALPFTRLAVGYGDFTPGYFGHNLKKLGGTTWTLQLATGIMYTSPALHWISKPDDMHAAFPSGSLERGLIKAIPAVWDETRVLPVSRIGGLVAVARRSGRNWFLSVLNGGASVNASIPLDFLPSGAFKATVVTDGGVPDSWTVRAMDLDGKATLTLPVKPGGGVVVWFPGS